MRVKNYRDQPVQVRPCDPNYLSGGWWEPDSDGTSQFHFFHREPNLPFAKKVKRNPASYEYLPEIEWRRPEPMDLHSNTEIQRAVQMVREIPGKTRPYEAEEILVDMIAKVTTLKEWNSTEVDKNFFGFYNKSILWAYPKSLFFRRHPHYYSRSNGLVPLCEPIVIRMIERFIYDEHGFAFDHKLDLFLDGLRLDYWLEWSRSIEDAGIDIDEHDLHNPRDWRIKLRRKLVRQGMREPITRAGDIQGTAAFLAEEVFLDEMKRQGISPDQSVAEIVSWVEASRPTSSGTLAAIRATAKGIWNNLLPIVPPNMATVELVKRLIPLDVNGLASKKQCERRIGTLRFLQRLVAQARSWDSHEVEVPTVWFKPRKVDDDTTSILGWSSGTYGRLMQILTDAGALRLVERGSKLKNQASRYALVLDDEGSTINWHRAETLMARP
jgi:hypothetical protein